MKQWTEDNGYYFFRPSAAKGFTSEILMMMIDYLYNLN